MVDTSVLLNTAESILTIICPSRGSARDENEMRKRVRELPCGCQLAGSELDVLRPCREVVELTDLITRCIEIDEDDLAAGYVAALRAHLKKQMRKK